MTERTSTDSQRQILVQTLRGALRGARDRRSELRYHVVRDVWSIAKRFGAEAIENVEVRDVPGVRDAVVHGYVDDRNRSVLAALCRAVNAKTFFEIGTNRGRTAWTVAASNPDLEVFTLDLPARESLQEVAFAVNQSDRGFFTGAWDRGEAYRETPEETRITTLAGDSATFDFSPYEGRMDLVFVDGAHSYDYVRSDTKAALRMLTPTGTIAWDDYPSIPGVYRHLTELAPTLDRPLHHILGTRLVLYSRQDLVGPRPAGGYGHLEVA